MSLLQSEGRRESDVVKITGDVDCMGGSEILWPPGTSSQVVSTTSPLPSLLTTDTTTLWSALCYTHYNCNTGQYSASLMDESSLSNPGV